MASLLKASGAVALATLMSRVLGMVREMAFASLLGTSLVAGAFQTAFLIPNLFRRLLGEGALTAAFIPIFKQTEKTEGDAAAWRAGSAVLSALALVSTLIVLLVASGITVALVFVDSKQAETTHLMLRLLRLMLPYMPLVCVAAVIMGMLNARGRFFVPALGSVMLNVVMIAAALWLAPAMGVSRESQVFGLAWGVLAAGFVQAAFQFPSLHRQGFRFQLTPPWREPAVWRVAKQMLPAITGVAAYQINVLATQCLAFGLDPSMNSAFGYAVRLMELPQGVFGISVATFLLPTLSGLAAAKDMGGFRVALRQGLDQVVAVNLLASVLLVVLAEPIVRLLFERGSFTAESTERVAGALRYLAPGLVAFSLVNILARAFYALGDTKTPMRISLVILASNFALAAILIWPLRERGLGLANTLSATVNTLWLGLALRARMKNLGLSPWKRLVPAKILAATVAGGMAWLTFVLWRSAVGHETLWLQLGETFLPMLVATVDYLLLCYLLRVPFARDVVRALSKKGR